jgi:hypothetical protein
MPRRLLATTLAVALPFGVAAAGAARAQDLTINLDGPQDAAAPGNPGTLTVRLGGKLQFLLGDTGLGGANTGYFQDPVTGYAAAAPFAVAPSGTLVPAGSPGARAAVARSQTLPAFRPADIGRLYPHLDGVAANGLRYGLALTVAINNIGEPDGGLYKGPLAPGRVSDQPQLWQAYGYVASDDWGTLRVGATDGPSSLFMTGNFERFNTGGWNGAVPYAFPRQWNTIWPFADVPAEYSTLKLVYLSPRYDDFDAALSFEPSGNGLLGAGQSGCAAAPLRAGTLAVGAVSQAGAGCDFVAGTTVGAQAGRRDTVDAALRYRGQLGEVGLAAYVAYTGSAAVHASGDPAQTYQGLQVGAGGVQAYYAGVTVGGMLMGGAINNTTASYGLQPAGTAPQTAWLLGASYAIERVTIGASYFSSWQAGYQTAATAATVGTYHAQGAAAGGTYALRPGVSLYLEYLWGQIRQNGYDLDVFSLGATHNKLDIQYVGLGTGISW